MWNRAFDPWDCMKSSRQMAYFLPSDISKNNEVLIHNNSVLDTLSRGAFIDAVRSMRSKMDTEAN